MTEQNRIKDELADQNHGMVPSRYYRHGQCEVLDAVREVLAEWEMGSRSADSFADQVRTICIEFEEGPVEPGNWSR